MRRIQRTHIVDDLRLHIVAIVACQLTRDASRVGLALVVVKIGVNHQGADDAIAFHTCIGVEGQTQMQRYTQTRLLRVSLTAASEVVHPLTACAVVVRVVVATIGVIVDAVRDTGVLQPVTSSLQIACHTAGLSPLLVG